MANEEVQPYWKGLDGAPILVRPHVIRDSGAFQ